MIWVNPFEYLWGTIVGEQAMDDERLYLSFGVELCLLIIVLGMALAVYLRDEEEIFGIIFGALFIGATSIVLWPVYLILVFFAVAAGLVVGAIALIAMGLTIIVKGGWK